MSILLWVLQALAALVYGASGFMKLFQFDKISVQVPSFGALPRKAWLALGIREIPSVILSGVLGLLMAFIAFGRASR
jgi:uncharacterized membrane protein YphA (DoxX/SURF4 family)